MRRKRPHNLGEVRVIGGTHRGRKIFFPHAVDLRPTPNRIRETLFNWLAPYIQGASCLDLFAGSGALSFEALSRGARYCLALDFAKENIEALIENRSLLSFANMDIIQAKFPYPHSYLKENFNIVFIDPPFHQNYVPHSLKWLQECCCLKKDALIYVESEIDSDVLILPNAWQILKDKRAGHVRYSLIHVSK